MSPRSKHPEAVIYCATVLFAHGRSERDIGKALKLSRGAVSGIINRFGNGYLRNATRDRRQEFLDKAAADRRDVLPDMTLRPHHFRVKHR